MKRILIAAAFALALPAFAADEAAKTPAPRKAEKAAPAREQAAKQEAREIVASEGISKDVTLVNGATKPANGESKPQALPTLRFQDWVHDEDGE